MPPPIALLLGFTWVAWLLRQDTQWRSVGTHLMLVAGIFLAVIGSRPISYWMGGGGNADGNPINTVFFALLLAISFLGLNARGFSWSGTIGQNRSLFLLYGFFIVSGTWSVDPPTSVKRLVKDFICVLVALLIRTEPDPVRSCRTLFVRVSYVLFPLSLILGKYFPGVGRSYSMGGEPMFTGVTTQKNSLGEICFVFGLFLLWELQELLAADAWRTARRRILLNAATLALGVWLLVLCDSKTSLVCLLMSSALLLARGWFVRRPHGKSLLVVLLIGVMALFAFDSMFGFSETALKALNRNPTLTGRTEIWRLVLEQQHDPMLGGGFYMFWDSDKGKAVANALISLNSAHSGYIETYLDGGIIGCFFLGVFLLATGIASVNRFFQDAPFASIALPLWLAALIYNFSETSFLRLDPLWFTLLLVSLRLPKYVAAPARSWRQASAGARMSPTVVGEM